MEKSQKRELTLSLLHKKLFQGVIVAQGVLHTSINLQSSCKRAFFLVLLFGKKLCLKFVQMSHVPFRGQVCFCSLRY